MCDAQDGPRVAMPRGAISRRVLVGALLSVPLLPLGRSAAIAEGETTPSEEILDVSHLRERFDRQADFFLKYNLDRSRTGDSYSYYDMAYGVDGYVAMFEATGDEGYLDEALGRLIDNAISDATPSLTLGPLAFKDSYKGWISHHSEVAGQEVAFYESCLWRYVCRLVRALRSKKSTYGQSGYRRQYECDSGVHGSQHLRQVVRSRSRSVHLSAEH